MSGNQVGRRTADGGHRTAEKAKIICPPPQWGGHNNEDPQQCGSLGQGAPMPATLKHY